MDTENGDLFGEMYSVFIKPIKKRSSFPHQQLSYIRLEGAS